MADEHHQVSCDIYTVNDKFYFSKYSNEKVLLSIFIVSQFGVITFQVSNNQVASATILDSEGPVPYTFCWASTCILSIKR